MLSEGSDIPVQFRIAGLKRRYSCQALRFVTFVIEMFNVKDCPTDELVLAGFTRTTVDAAE